MPSTSASSWCDLGRGYKQWIVAGGKWAVFLRGGVCYDATLIFDSLSRLAQ
jgi:hypothetical protein